MLFIPSRSISFPYIPDLVFSFLFHPLIPICAVYLHIFGYVDFHRSMVALEGSILLKETDFLPIFVITIAHQLEVVLHFHLPSPCKDFFFYCMCLCMLT